jgi:Dolichyl-phosphate-mannose-protein mannosyltransferase
LRINPALTQIVETRSFQLRTALESPYAESYNALCRMNLPGLECCRRIRLHNPLVSTLLATLLAGLVLLPLLGHKLLTNWDEGVYAEVSREMLSGGWLVPSWNHQPWFEKPPLMLWTTAGFFRIFGVNEFCARAGSAFSGIALVALLHGWLAHKQETAAAWLSTVMLLATFGFLHVCRVGEMDVLLSLGCCIALCGLSAVEERRLWGWYLFWGGFAIAAMTKGGASIVLLFTVLLLALIERWDLHRFGKHGCWGCLLFLSLVLPWHLYMAVRFGQRFLRVYVGYHVMARAVAPLEGHITHFWYYLWVLLVSAPPFVLLYPFALAAAVRRAELRVWAVFALVVVGFFTLVQTRLPHYIAPSYPAFAVLTGLYLADANGSWLTRRHSLRAWMVFAGLAISLCVAGGLLTAGGRKRLHSPLETNGRVVPDGRQPATLLRGIFRDGEGPPGPVLTWWEGTDRSIATSVFYSGRLVQQVLPGKPPGNALFNRYTFAPVALDMEVVQEPRIILLDRSLVEQIPDKFVYQPIAIGRDMEAGSIRRRSQVACE